jgi:hypothetical protein
VLEPAITSTGMTAQVFRALLPSEHGAISIPGTAKSFSSGNFLNMMEPFDLAPLIFAKIINIQDHHLASIHHKAHLKKNLPIVHPPLTHIKKKISFTSFKTVLILGIMLLNASYSIMRNKPLPKS